MTVTKITIDEITGTDEYVSSESFGINFAFNFQSFGDKPWEKFDEIVEHYTPSQIRYPAGTYAETVFDIENPNATSYVNAQGQTRTLKTMTEMLDFAKVNHIDAVVVIPTAFALGAKDTTGNRTFDESAEAKIRDYVKFLLEESEGGTLSRLEIGNEYAAYMNAVEYGRVASRISEITQDVIDEYVAFHDLPADWQEPEIAIQIMSQSPGGGNSIDDLNARNQNVLNQFDEDELAAVDGVVDHFYYFDGRNEGDVNEHDIHNIREAVDVSMARIDLWNAATGRDLTHVVSEWNVSQHSENVTGLRQIPYVMELFSGLVASGVDQMDFWSTQYHSTSLYNAYGEAMIMGRVFTEFRETLNGAEVVEVTPDNDNVSISGFQTADGLTLFVSSLVDGLSEFEFDLAAQFGNFRVSSATAISVDMSTSDGMHRGQSIPHYLEPDVSYTFTDYVAEDFAGEFNPSFVLGAYETVVVTFTQQETVAVEDTTDVAEEPAAQWGDLDNSKLGGLWGDHTASASSDWLTADADQVTQDAIGTQMHYSGGLEVMDGDQQGLDTAVFSDFGSAIWVDLDYRDLEVWTRHKTTAEHGGGWTRIADLNDVENVIASEFDDRITGSAESNLIDGGGGNDAISSEGGDDILNGGAGNDTLRAGDGDDRLLYDGGRDILDGGVGEDVVDFSGFGYAVWVDLETRGPEAWTRFLDNAENGSNWSVIGDLDGIENVDGTLFNDRIWGDEGVNVLRGLDGDDKLFGEGGNDIISGGAGDDVIYAGAGDDLIFFTGCDTVERIYGGDGVDAVDMSGFDAGVWVALDTSGQKIWTRHSDSYEDGGAWDVVARMSDIEALVGTQHDDYLRGDEGDNEIAGMGGDDKLTGGAGNDIFVFNLGDTGADIIVDFEDGADLLAFSGAQWDDLSISGDASETTIAHAGGTITLEGVDVAQITEEDFLLG